MSAALDDSVEEALGILFFAMMSALPIILFTEHPTAPVPPSRGEGCVPLLRAIFRAGKN